MDRIKKSVLLSVASGVALCAQGVVLNETFNGNTREKQSLPDSAKWFGAALSVVETAPGNFALKNSPTGVTIAHAVAYIAPADAPISLAPGDSIQVSFDVTPVSKNPGDGPNDFRFGLLHSGSARLTSNANTPLAVKGGYGIFVCPQKRRVALRDKGSVVGALFSAVTENRWGKEDVKEADALLPMVKGTTYSVKLSVTRLVNNILKFDYSITDGTAPASASFTRNTKHVYEFDTIGFGWGNAFGDGLLDNVNITVVRR